MFDVLDILIEQILKLYIEVNEMWKNTEAFQNVNLKKKQVIEIPENEKIWNMIKAYRSYIAVQQFFVLNHLSAIQTENNRISARIKQLNSIEYKIYRYISGALEGKVPINKCFNDLFGIRIIINAEFSYEDLQKHLFEKFPELKVIDSSKNGYHAFHIYFMGENVFFPWELQIWEKSHETNNLESHKLYKQDYTSWEQKYKNN